MVWMLHIRRARHPGPGKRFFYPGQLSVEFVNVGGWLTSGDLALDSCAQFLAVAEHRLIPSRATNFIRLVTTLSGLLCVKIGLLVVMLGSGLSVLEVVPCLSHLCHFSIS